MVARSRIGLLTVAFLVIAAGSACDSCTEVQPSPSATAVQVDSYEEVIALPIGTLLTGFDPPQ